jgi:hypothetical protein
MEIVGLNGSDEDIGEGDDFFDDIVGVGGAEYIKVIEDTTGYIDNEKDYIYGVKEGSNPLDYFEPLEPQYYLEMRQGIAQNGVTNGTGSELVVYSNNTKSEILAVYTLIIFGDLDLDGWINNIDAGIIEQHIYGVCTIKENFDVISFAADVDFDGELTTVDALRIFHEAVYWRPLPIDAYARQDLVIVGSRGETSVMIDDDMSYVFGLPEGADPNEHFKVTNNGIVDFVAGPNNSVNNGTGSKVVVYSNPTRTKVIKEYTYIVFGDVTGDGKITLADAVALGNHLNNIKQITDPDIIFAGDLNYSGELDEEDLEMINAHLDGSQPIPPNILY